MMKVLAIVAAAGLVAGCADSRVAPVGTGSGRDEFPPSPCACIPIQQEPIDDGWQMRYRAGEGPTRPIGAAV